MCLVNFVWLCESMIVCKNGSVFWSAAVKKFQLGHPPAFAASWIWQILRWGCICSKPCNAILLFAKPTYYDYETRSASSLIYWIENCKVTDPFRVVSSSYPPQPRLKCLASSRIRSLAIKSTLLPIRSFLALFHHIARKGNLSLLGKEILRWI